MDILEQAFIQKHVWKTVDSAQSIMAELIAEKGVMAEESLEAVLPFEHLLNRLDAVLTNEIMQITDLNKKTIQATSQISKLNSKFRTLNDCSRET
jgi:hypothetical protein